MTEAQRSQIERALLRERNEVSETVRRLLASVGDTTHDRGRGGDDFSPSSAGAGYTDDEAVALRSARALSEIDDALSRLRSDPLRFGLCETCHTSIPMERLRLVPGTRHCLLHAPQ